MQRLSAQGITHKKLAICNLFARIEMASVRKLKTGTWIATVRRTGHPSKSKCFRGKAEAVRWSVDQEARVMQQPPPDHAVVSGLPRACRA